MADNRACRGVGLLELLLALGVGSVVILVAMQSAVALLQGLEREIIFQKWSEESREFMEDFRDEIWLGYRPMLDRENWVEIQYEAERCVEIRWRVLRQDTLGAIRVSTIRYFRNELGNWEKWENGDLVWRSKMAFELNLNHQVLSKGKDEGLNLGASGWIEIEVIPRIKEMEGVAWERGFRIIYPRFPPIRHSINSDLSL